MMVTDIATVGHTLEVVATRPLFDVSLDSASVMYSCDLATDGRFLAAVGARDAVTPITLLMNWPGMLPK
jgi:1-deoxy-D-xylulose 5-phosphate reductoisomerase